MQPGGIEREPLPIHPFRKAAPDVKKKIRLPRPVQHGVQKQPIEAPLDEILENPQSVAEALDAAGDVFAGLAAAAAVGDANLVRSQETFSQTKARIMEGLESPNPASQEKAREKAAQILGDAADLFQPDKPTTPQPTITVLYEHRPSPQSAN